MEVFLQNVLCSSHCWDNYQWKWDPRLILFLILRIMLPIIWERFKGLFRLFPSHSHNYTAMVTWAEQVKESTSCALAAMLRIFSVLPGCLVLHRFHICISKHGSLGCTLLDLYKSRCALRSCSYSINCHVLVYWCWNIWKVNQVCFIDYPAGAETQYYDILGRLASEYWTMTLLLIVETNAAKLIGLHSFSRATKCLLVLYLLNNSTVKEELLFYLEKDRFSAHWKVSVASITLICFENNHSADINFSLFVVIASLLRKHSKAWHAPCLLSAS